jgi:hypothetical protein
MRTVSSAQKTVIFWVVLFTVLIMFYLFARYRVPNLPPLTFFTFSN